jgi:hypothetical protein
MSRILSFVVVIMTFCSTAAAQKQKPVKDTAAFLVSAFRDAWGEQKVSENGKHAYTNHYTITSFAVTGCTLQAVIKMKNIAAGKAPFTYTLSYSIPLQDIYSIKAVPGETRNDRKYEYRGAPLEFRVDGNRFSIQYKMVEDLTGRVEADAGYNESTLWCNPPKSKQVLEVLNAWLKRCQQ